MLNSSHSHAQALTCCDSMLTLWPLTGIWQPHSSYTRVYPGHWGSQSRFWVAQRSNLSQGHPLGIVVHPHEVVGRKYLFVKLRTRYHTDIFKHEGVAAHGENHKKTGLSKCRSIHDLYIATSTTGALQKTRPSVRSTSST